MWSPYYRPSLVSRHQTCPSSSSPAPGVFSEHLRGQTKNGACWSQGSVFNIIVTTVKTVSIRQNQRRERRTSLEWEKPPGTQELPGTHLFLPMGPSHQGPCVLTKTHAAPEAGLGTMSHRSCAQRPCVCSSPLCVLPLGDPQHMNWGCCAESRVAFLLFILGHSHEVRRTFEWVAALCFAGWKHLAVSY